MADVATTILNQLGGNKFIAMTGAKSLSKDTNSLTFKLPTTPKNKVNAVTIKLDGDDTYTMTFFNMKGLNVTTVKKLDGLQVDNLKSSFTSFTGLLTSMKGESVAQPPSLSGKTVSTTNQLGVEHKDIPTPTEHATPLKKSFKTKTVGAQKTASLVAKTLKNTKNLGVEHNDIPTPKK